jgi:putative transcriptional regulator
MTGFKSFQLPPPVSPEEIPQYLRGYLLISETELRDPNFFRTVVYLLTHDANGAMGLVINRPSESRFANLAENMENSPFADYQVFIGGPVDQNYLFAMHSGFPGNIKSDGAIEASPGIVFEPDFSVLTANYLSLDQNDDFELRFFAGYAGWAAGQLENELQRKDWVVLPASQELVFAEDSGRAWEQALSRKGGLYWLAAETGYKPSIN